MGPHNASDSTERLALRVSGVSSISMEDADEAAERAWQRREQANSELLHALGVQMAQCLRSQYPETRLIVLREDLSHLPAHGHVDQILNGEGQSVVAHLPADGHGWPTDADDLAWEIYHVASHQFVRDPDGTKRLTIEIADD